MTQARYPVLFNGSEILPVSNGSFQTLSQLPCNADNCQVYIEFYSDLAGTIPVTPTSGTIQASASPMGNNFLSPSNVSTINAIACSTPNSTYTPPYFWGRIAFGQVTFNSIVGAQSAKVIFWRY